MDHLGIARGDALADGRLLLQHHRRKASLAERMGARQPHRSGPDDRDVEV